MGEGATLPLPHPHITPPLSVSAKCIVIIVIAFKDMTELIHDDSDTVILGPFPLSFRWFCFGAFSQQLQVVAANLITVEPAESSKSSMYYNLQFLKQNLADVVIQVEH